MEYRYKDLGKSEHFYINTRLRLNSDAVKRACEARQWLERKNLIEYTEFDALFKIEEILYYSYRRDIIAVTVWKQRVLVLKGFDTKRVDVSEKALRVDTSYLENAVDVEDLILLHYTSITENYREPKLITVELRK